MLVVLSYAGSASPMIAAMRLKALDPSHDTVSDLAVVDRDVKSTEG